MLRWMAALISEVIKAKISEGELQRLIDELKDVLSRTWEQEKRRAVLEAIRDLERFEGPLTAEELKRLEDRIGRRLGADLAAVVRQPAVDVTEAVYGLGLKEAAEAAGLLGAGVKWNLPDLQSLDVLNRNLLFWVGDYYDSQVRGAVREVLQEFFEGGYTRDQAARMLEEAFAGLGDKPAAYWDLLADHTCTKVREIGRLSGYEQAGVEYLEIRAWLDARTTAICRSLHGRIIPLREVRRFVDGYFRACESGDKEAVKKAWPMWTGKRFRGEGVAGLPSARMADKGIGLPPYHFRCRTITVPHFEILDAQGRNVVNRGQEAVFWDGEKEVKHKIAWEYLDKLGRKAIVTNDGKHILRHPEMTEDKIIAALRSVTHVGYNKKYPDELVYLSKNGVFTVFRGNVVYTQYIPKGSPRKFFYDNAYSISKAGSARWGLSELFS